MLNILRLPLKSTLGVCAVIFLSLCTVIAKADDKAEAIQMFEQAVASREKIKSYHSLVTINIDEPSIPLRCGEAVFDISFEGTKRRIFKKMEQEQREMVFCIDCLPGIFAALTLHPKIYDNSLRPKIGKSDDSPNRKYPLAVLSLREPDLETNGKESDVFSTYDYILPSLRDMGMVPSLCSHWIRNETLNYFFNGLSKSQNVSIGKEDVEGDWLTKISWTSTVKTGFMFELSDGTKMEALLRNTLHFWIDPKKDCIVRRVVYENSSKCMMTLKNTVKKHEPSGFWYPDSWVIDETRNGQYYAHETGTVQMLSINKPFPQDVFSLSNIPQLEIGTQVDWRLKSPPPVEGRLFWSGKGVVGKGDIALSPELRARSITESRQRFLIIFCINVAIISALLARWFYRRKI